MAKISVNNLSFHYEKGTPVLKNINLKLNQRSTAIIGQNGAGKTTLVKLLKGLLEPVEGNILINGLNTKEHSAASLASEIGLVFQNPSDQIFNNNVLEEVMFGPLNINYSEKEAKKLAYEAIERVNLEAMVDENPYDLSLSERKLITIASILAMDPEIIIFDEPTIGQDYENIELIKDIIRKEIDDGKLVITINHDMDFVSELFDRIIVINQGEVIADGSAKEIFRKEDVLNKAHLEIPSVKKISNNLGIEKNLLTKDEFIEFFEALSEN